MIPVVILGFLALLVYAMVRATRRWGVSALLFFAAGITFLNVSGVWAERLWGPRWSWSFAHHNRGDAWGQFALGILYLALGLWYRAFPAPKGQLKPPA